MRQVAGRTRMADAVGGVKHDEGKRLQMKTGSDLLELEKVYSSSAIQKLPQNLLREAEVKKLSREGTTSRDRELMRLKVQHAEGRRTRRRAQFPSIEELMEKASTAKVDNDQNWKDIDEETAENQEFLEALLRTSTWSAMKKADLVADEESVGRSLG